MADGAIGLLAGERTLCCGVADLCLHTGALSDALALLQAVPSSSSGCWESCLGQRELPWLLPPAAAKEL